MYRKAAPIHEVFHLLAGAYGRGLSPEAVQKRSRDRQPELETDHFKN